MKKTIKTLISILVIGLTLTICNYSTEVKATSTEESADSQSVNFATTEVKDGQAIEVSVTDSTGEERYEWFVGNTKVENSGNTYIPSQ